MANEPLWRRYVRFVKPDPRADVDDELNFHMETLVRRYESEGMSTEAAQRAARAQFGDVEATRRDLAARTSHQARRAERREFWLRLWGDARVAVRKLIREPGFALASIATLALGIGANAGVFSVVNAALLRPLPFRQADRIVRLVETSGARMMAVAPSNFADWRDQSKSFEGMAAYSTYPRTLTGHGDAQTIPHGLVTADFFDVMGAFPAHGRAFSAQENTVGNTSVVILSDAIWRSTFGADTGIIGKVLQLDGVPRTVVGIMPAGFDFPSGSKLWTPWVFSPEDLATQRGAHYLTVVARLKPGVAAEGSFAEIKTIAERLALQYPDASKGESATGLTLRDALVGSGPRRALYVLFGAVALVTLIACANVANLLLARGAARRREMAVRASLGARPRDLIGLAFTESVILAIVGGAGGVAVAWGCTRALDALRPESLRQLGAARVDLNVLAFAFGLSVLTGLAFGLAPALQAVRASGRDGTLRGDSRGSTLGRDGWRVRSGLVAAELALAVILLAGAGLMLRSFDKLLSVDPGFNAGSALTFDLSLPDGRYGKPPQASVFYDDLLGRLRAIPGVKNAEAISGMPVSGHSYSISTHAIDGRTIPDPEQPSTQIRVVTPGIFSAMGMRVVHGRAFTDADRLGGTNVVIVSERAAKLLLNGVDPIGHKLEISGGLGLGRGRAFGEVVGVVNDIHDDELGTPPRPTLYFPHAQWPLLDMVVLARVGDGTDPLSIATTARARLKDVDPDVPMQSMIAMDEIVHASVAEPRFAMLLLSAFAVVALALATVGIFGVISYVVGQRTREIGVRIALGAGAQTVVGETVRRALSPMAIGIGLGVAGALALTGTMQKLLFEIPPSDPVTFVAVTTMIAFVAVVAAWVPARRASRVDPVIALRNE